MCTSADRAGARPLSRRSCAKRRRSDLGAPAPPAGRTVYHGRMSHFEQIVGAAHQARRLYWRLFEPTIVGVRALLIHQQQVMLVRHTYLKGWYLPGGRVDRGETALHAVRREVAEECSLTVHDASLLAVYANTEQNRNDHILLYEVRSFSPRPPSRWSGLRRLEIAQAQFFPLAALPPDT